MYRFGVGSGLKFIIIMIKIVLPDRRSISSAYISCTWLMIVWWVKHWSYNISWNKVFVLTGASVVCLQQCTVYQRGLAGDTDDKQ